MGQPGSQRLARPAGLEPATTGLEGRTDGPARNRPRRFPLIFRPFSRVGGNRFPPQTVTACHTCVTPQTAQARAVRSLRAVKRGWLVRTPNANDAPAPRVQSSMLDSDSADKIGRHAGHQLECLSPTGFRSGRSTTMHDVLAPAGRPECPRSQVEVQEHRRPDWQPLSNFGIELDAAATTFPDAMSHPGTLAATRRPRRAGSHRASRAYDGSYAGRGRTRSCARSAAYARAA